LVGKGWQSSGDLIEKVGQSRWFEQAWLTKKHAYQTGVLAHGTHGEEAPWLLATNLPTLKAALSVYRRRMWIKEMSGNSRKHGFHLESPHVHFLRLSRVTLVVALLYLWMVSFGSQVIKNGRRHLVDRRGRTDFANPDWPQCSWSVSDKWAPVLNSVRSILLNANCMVARAFYISEREQSNSRPSTSRVKSGEHRPARCLELLTLQDEGVERVARPQPGQRQQ
jgi:hypothetical protein